MLPKISACVFVKDSVENPFCLWESMASLIGLADEYIVMDLGSTDGTLEILEDLASNNHRIRIVHGSFHTNNPSIFATLANDLVGMCKNEIVLHHQADEIFHEDLIDLMKADLAPLAERIPSDWPGMNFWRIQLENNFQRVKWMPHPINHLDLKRRLHHVGDGMNTDRPWAAPFVGDTKSGRPWEVEFKDYPHSLPTNQMVLDVSMTGGFLDNIPERRRKHAPIWGENPEVIYLHGHAVNLQEWHERESQNPEWTAKTSPFNLPAIMRDLVGETRYRVREEVLHQIAEG